MSDTPQFVSVDEYLKLPRDPETWLLRNLLPTGGSGVLYAPPKVGKTYLALQMANAIGGGADSWMEFEVCKRGKVLILELDTPRSIFTTKYFEPMRDHGKLNFPNVMVADNEILKLSLVDIQQPQHQQMLKEMVQAMDPVLVIIDTLRKIHSADENSSTEMSNVMSKIKAVVHPAAVLLISHERKPSPDGEKDIMTDLRGSTSVVGEMDAILRLTQSQRLFYAGRSIEPGNLKVRKMDIDECLMWEPDPEDGKAALAAVLMDKNLETDRAKARELARMTGKNFDACMSTIRRKQGKLKN